MIVDVTDHKQDNNSFLNEEHKEHFRKLLQKLQTENAIDIQTAQATGDENFLVNLMMKQEDIHDALERLKKGQYGLCQESGQKIPIDRLNAMPDTRFTKQIQQERDAEQAVSPGSKHDDDEYIHDASFEDHYESYEQREYNF